MSVTYARNFTKGNTTPWIFFTSFKSLKLYQIGQRITYRSIVVRYDFIIFLYGFKELTQIPEDTVNPLGTEFKLNLPKTFRSRPGRLRNVLSKFNLSFVQGELVL